MNSSLVTNDARRVLGQAIVIALVAFVASGAQLQSTAQTLLLPLPPPRTGPSAPINPARLIFQSQNTSIILAQVISVRSSDTVPAPNNNDYIPNVSTASLQVMEVLSGPTVSGIIEIVNPVETPVLTVPDHLPNATNASGKTTQFSFTYKGDGSSLPPPATSRMRRSELWIIFRDDRTGEIDVRLSFCLSGPDDPVLAEYRAHLAWMARQDFPRAMAEMKASVENQKFSELDRYTALLTLQKYAYSASTVGSSSVRQGQLYKKMVTELLCNPTLPPELKTRVASMTSISLVSELAPDSYDTLQLRALLSIVANSPNNERVYAAASSLSTAMVQQPRAGTGSRTIYFCPEIVQVLEDRKTADAEMGRISYAAGTLSAMDLGHRRTLADIQKEIHAGSQITVFVRDIPPIGSGALAERLLAASRR